jgi:hypothetical protein
MYRCKTIGRFSVLSEYKKGDQFIGCTAQRPPNGFAAQSAHQSLCGVAYIF